MGTHTWLFLLPHTCLPAGMVLVSRGEEEWGRKGGGRGVGAFLTISFRSTARAESRLAGLLRSSSFSDEAWDLLRSSWMRVFLLYTFSISLQEPPLELRIPLSPLGSGGSPSMAQTFPPPRLSWELWRQFMTARGRRGHGPWGRSGQRRGTQQGPREPTNPGHIWSSYEVESPRLGPAAAGAPRWKPQSRRRQRVLLGDTLPLLGGTLGALFSRVPSTEDRPRGRAPRVPHSSRSRRFRLDRLATLPRPALALKPSGCWAAAASAPLPPPRSPSAVRPTWCFLPEPPPEVEGRQAEERTENADAERSRSEPGHRAPLAFVRAAAAVGHTRSAPACLRLP